MKIISGCDFDSYWKNEPVNSDDEKTEAIVKEIIAAVRKDGDAAVKRYASMFDKSSPEQLEVPAVELKRAYDALRASDPALVEALEFAAENINRFSIRQREPFADFEFETRQGVFTGQKIIPVERAAVYVPGGRFPLFSSVLMCVIPAFSAGVKEVILSSPPAEDGLPDRKTLAAAAIAGARAEGAPRVFAIGGAQAIAALSFGTQSVPRVDVIVGPGNRFVAAAKRILFGEVGIDFIAGPSDVLVIADEKASENPASAMLIAADMIAQAEHDPDARARALVPSKTLASQIAAALEKRALPAARSSLDAGGLIIVYQERDEAIRIANAIAPEHLELHVADDNEWIPRLKNYGSLFIGSLSAEVLGDYSAGINHTLPTSGGARFTGGLSVRHFLKTVTTLRCSSGVGFDKTSGAAEIIARAEGLEGHAQSAVLRKKSTTPP